MYNCIENKSDVDYTAKDGAYQELKESVDKLKKQLTKEKKKLYTAMLENKHLNYEMRILQNRVETLMNEINKKIDDKLEDSIINILKDNIHVLIDENSSADDNNSDGDLNKEFVHLE